MRRKEKMRRMRMTQEVGEKEEERGKEEEE